MAVKKLLLPRDKASGLDDVFYLTPTSEKEDFWQVRVKATHFVMVATGSKQRALECLYKIVQVYKTMNRLNNAINDASYPMSKVDVEKAYRQLAESIEYKEEVESTVKKAMGDYNTNTSSPDVPLINRKMLKKCLPDYTPSKNEPVAPPVIDYKEIEIIEDHEEVEDVPQARVKPLVNKLKKKRPLIKL